jgi:hypothetical protein
MFKQITTAMAILTAALTLDAAAAEARFNALRCEARRAGCEKRYFKCLSRCEGHEEERTSRPVVNGRVNDCEDTCDTRHLHIMERVNSKAPCASPPGEADPNDCEVQLLSIRRSHLIRVSNCRARAGRTGFDVQACEAAKRIVCETKVDEVLSQPVCLAGRAGITSICEMP